MDDFKKPRKPSYPMNDLGSVYTHWDPKKCKNVPTENKLPKGVDNKDGSDGHSNT